MARKVGRPKGSKTKKAPVKKAAPKKRGRKLNSGKTKHIVDARTGKRLYFGIEKMPKGRIHAPAKTTLEKGFARRYGEYQIPPSIMVPYLKARHLPPPNYKRYGGSKTARRR